MPRDYKLVIFSPGDKIPSEIIDEVYDIYSASFRSSERWEKKELQGMVSEGSWGRRYLTIAQDLGSGKILAGGVFSYHPRSRMLYCSSYFVSPFERSRGVGKAFFRRVQQSLAGRHPKALYFGMFTHNAFSQQPAKDAEKYGSNFLRARFWEGLGFARVEIPESELAFRRSGWDLRVKRLSGFAKRQPRKIERYAVARILIDLFRNPEFGFGFAKPAGKLAKARHALTVEGKHELARTLGGISLFSKPSVRKGSRARPRWTFKPPLRKVNDALGKAAFPKARIQKPK